MMQQLTLVIDIDSDGDTHVDCRVNGMRIYFPTSNLPTERWTEIREHLVEHVTDTIYFRQKERGSDIGFFFEEEKGLCTIEVDSYGSLGATWFETILPLESCRQAFVDVIEQVLALPVVKTE